MSSRAESARWCAPMLLAAMLLAGCGGLLSPLDEDELASKWENVQLDAYLKTPNAQVEFQCTHAGGLAEAESWQSIETVTMSGEAYHAYGARWWPYTTTRVLPASCWRTVAEPAPSRAYETWIRALIFTWDGQPLGPASVFAQDYEECFETRTLAKCSIGSAAHVFADFAYVP